MDNSLEHIHGVGDQRVRRECELHFCAKPVRPGNGTLCEGHYNQRRKGRPFSELRPRRISGGCGIDGCEKERKRGRYCAMHTARVHRHGDPDAMVHQRDRNLPRGSAHANWTGENATYNAVHFRLRNKRGKPSEHSCFECGEAAKQWAFYHNRGAGIASEYGPYSVSLEDYEAMCVPCHKRMDLAHKKGSSTSTTPAL